MIPKEERDADRAICEAAYPPPWIHRRDGGGRGVSTTGEDGSDDFIVEEGSNGNSGDLNFIAHARGRLPAYIDALDEMDRRVAEVEREAAEREALATKYRAAGEVAAASMVMARACAYRHALRILQGDSGGRPPAAMERRLTILRAWAVEHRREDVLGILDGAWTPPCQRCGEDDGLLQQPDNGLGWRPGLVLTPEAEDVAKEAFRGRTGLPCEVMWRPCPRCGGTAMMGGDQ